MLSFDLASMSEQAAVAQTPGDEDGCVYSVIVRPVHADE